MDSAPPVGTGVPQSADELPPEAIALAGRFFDAARSGQTEIFEQALPRGLPANLTNDKGDTLVSPQPCGGNARHWLSSSCHSRDFPRLRGDSSDKWCD
jgi:hypothetical protein